MTHFARARLLFTLAAALAAPAAADVYVSNRGGNQILVFADGATGNVPPLRTITGPATQISSGNLNGIALDAENGEVFVSLATNRILVFDAAANGNVAPLRSIAGPLTGMSFAAGIAVDPVFDELYVSSANTDALLVFSRTASGNVAPLREIQGGATGINQPTAVFVDLDADEVFVTNEASVAGVSVFPRLADGNVPPLRTIMGPATTFSFAVGIFTNPATGEHLGTDLFSGSLLTFPAGANGNVAPTSQLGSPSLASAAGMTLTNAGEILVNDFFGDAVLAFDVAASGPTAPLRDLRGPLTQLDTPVYVVTTDGPFPGAVLTQAPPASVALRNAGTNPNSYDVSNAPVLGEPLTFEVDLSTTGDAFAFVYLSGAPATVVLPDGMASLLAAPFKKLPGIGVGPSATIGVNLPLDLSLAGLTLYTQAVHLSPGVVLTNAVDLTLGI